MDHELKQRLIGAVVVTALAAIFIPMLFDDPVDTSGKAVTELTIPQAPSDSSPEAAQNLPADKNQVLNRPDTELSVSEDEEIGAATATGEGQASLPDGEPTDKAAVVEEEGNNKDSGPAEDLSVKQTEENKAATLDSSNVHESLPQEDSDQATAKTIEPVKKPRPTASATTKKTAVPTKTKAKPDVKPEKVTAKSQNDSAPKVKSKLVRYSIQAGSFSKKENAQALVEKLRKQGMSATMSAKGDLYRVKIGPELDKKKATDMKTKLDKQNIKSLLVSE
jgi:DedD protein